MRRLSLFLLTLALTLAACSGARDATEVVTPPEPPILVEDAAPEATPTLDPAVLAEPVALDPDVRTGTLANGLTYYVRRNAEPQDRAELRLVVNAGSVLEDEDQRGLAHFLEHMAFNGTEAFPETELVSYLEGIGMRFGPDLNAYTSFDETVYLLQVPTDSADLLETGFEVLREWAGAVALTPEEVDKERGVVLEEWRLGRGAQGRISDQQLPVLFGGSRYAERLPIGEPEVIENAPTATVRRFYEDWYRPDLMAVVAVGDFDPDAVEAKIRSEFSALESPTDAPERPTFDLPPHDDTRFAIATDPEATTTSVAVIYKAEPRTTETVGDAREGLVTGLYLQMLNARLREITQRPGAPFLQGGAFEFGFVRAADVFGLSALVPEGGVPEALDALLTEAARVRRHGFTPGELERAKADLLRSAERAFNERDKTPSRAYASAYVDHFLEAEPAPSEERRYELAQLLLPTISVAEVNARAERVTGEGNRVIFVSAPEKEDAPAPEEDALRGVIAAVDAKTIEPYVDTVSDEALVAAPPAPMPITGESRYPNDTGLIEWTLANGARVVVKPTDFKNDEVLFAAFSPGGASLVEDARFRAAEFAGSAVDAGGVGAFSATDLEKKLAGQVVSVSPYVSGTGEGLQGSASPENLETLLQLTHLLFTAPRADADAFAAFKERVAAFIENRGSSPQAVFSDTLAVTLAQGHPRARPLATEDLDRLALDDALAVYRERFADADDFTFAFVGAVDPEALAPLVERYLATLPADTASAEETRDLGIRPPEGVVEKTVRRGIEPQARVQLVFSGDLRHDPDRFDPADGDAFAREQALARRERFLMESVAEALSIRLREELREDRGGVYGVGVRASPDRTAGTYTFTVGFGADPERVDELKAAVFDVIERFQAEGPDADLIATVKEKGRRGEETALRTNGYWLRAIAGAYRHGEAPSDYLYEDDLREGLTAEALRQAAERYLDPARTVRAVLLPETGDNSDG